ncbi:MAG: hypothetical protein ACREJ3_18545 [Polyangiaceae bacterium]
MRNRAMRLSAALLASCAVLFIRGVARAQYGNAETTIATMTCDNVESPGRVRCEVEASVEPGASITWGDVILVQTPAFVSALRGRIGPHDATLRESGRWRWALALVARKKGTGVVEGRVRMVVCRQPASGGAAICEPREVPIMGRVVVGE